MKKRSTSYALFLLLMGAGITWAGFWPAVAQEPGRSTAAPGPITSLSSGLQAAPADRFKPGELLVKFKSDVDNILVDSVPSRYGASYLRTLYGMDVQLWQVPEGQELEMVERLTADPLVEYAEPNYLYRASATPNDPDYDRQWAHVTMQSAAAWDISTGRNSITIAIVDTGIDEGHPDLAGKLVAGHDFVDGDANPHDLNGHGTHVAGIAAALTNNGIGVAGMDWQARIMPVRVLGREGSGWLPDIVSGINWAYQNGADVINLSLSGPDYSQTMQDAINGAYASGSLVVAAMGNCRTYAPPDCPVANPIQYPAAMDHVMAVAATGPADGYAYYSQFGSHCDIAAPGGDWSFGLEWGIYSTLPTYSSFYLHTEYGYSTDYDYLQGTSMATPYVAGLAALIWSVSPTLSPDQVQAAIQSTAVDRGPAGWDPDYGWGRIDALEALRAVAPPASPVLAPIDNPDMDGNYQVDWNDVPRATNYTLQEANNPAFASPKVRYNGPNSQYSITGQGQGTWYYRVLATNAAGSSPWSNAESTTVIGPPAAPALYPIDNPANGDAYRLGWSAVPTATGYRLEEDDNAFFNSPTVRYAGAALQYNVTGQPNGTWYYRVRAYNSAGDSPWSSTRSTTVSVAALPAPTLSPINNPDGDGWYEVTWSGVGGATSYTLEQSRSPYFEAPGEVYSGDATQYPVTAQPGGTWYYRVRAFGVAARSPWSNPQSTNVTAWIYLPLLLRTHSAGSAGGTPIPGE